MNLPRIPRRFVTFAVIGTSALPVDAGVLYLAMQAGSGLYLGRLVSYLCAATMTWALNRRFTFKDRSSPNRIAEWLRFLAANALGGAVNYAVYAALVTFSPLAAKWPFIGVAAGSLAGLVFNFTLSHGLVFKNRNATAAAASDRSTTTP